MRVSLAAISTDRVSSIAILTAGLLCGVSVFFVALPLAQSSPFPTPKGGGWVTEGPPSYQLAAASTSIVLAAPPSAAPTTAETRDDIGTQAAIEWEALTSPSSLIDRPVIDVLPSEQAGPSDQIQAAPEQTASIAPAKAPEDSPPAKRTGSTMDEVDNYLWEVYQRMPIKKDGAGDFTWKDPAAAKRINMSLQTYVIGGMDRDFREQLYHAGRAMDAEGIQWSILSAFRDDYRQGIAAGYKARVGNSLHGGSRATGGYGHGRAADIVNAEGNHSAVWRWIDRNGRKYGIVRPMPGADPAHIQSGGDWHRIASKLREGRTQVAEDKSATPQTVAEQETSKRRGRVRVARAGR